MKLTPTRMIATAAAVVAIGSSAFVAAKQYGWGALAPKAGEAAPLALVNNQAVTAADVEALMTGGMLKPVAVENAINRLLVADAARKLWPAEAQAVSESVAREALTSLYVRKKLGELQRDVADDEIARYYETNVKDELYSGQMIKYYLTQDAKDAVDMAEAIKQGNAPALSKLAWVNREGDHAVLPAGVPYGLYQQVKALQPGQFLGPWRVRDGILFLKLEERKASKRPDLPKVKDEIRQILAQQHLEQALKTLRDQAKIELK